MHFRLDREARSGNQVYNWSWLPRIAILSEQKEAEPEVWKKRKNLMLRTARLPAQPRPPRPPHKILLGPSMGFPSHDLSQRISTKISQPGDLSQMISAQWSPTCAWKQNLDNMTCRVAVQEEVLVATVVFLCSSSNYLFIAQSICVPIVLKRLSSDLCWGIQRLTMPSAAFWV